MKKIIALIGLLAGLFISPVFAQSPVITKPYGVTSGNVSSTIVSTNTFQSIWVASTIVNTGRTSCTIVNYGTHTMYVFFGPIANATLTNSIQLAANQAAYCNVGNVILKDQVSITGTAGDAFFAAQQ